MLIHENLIIGTYNTYLTTIPALFWAMFVGSWIDRYVKGRKILMLFSVGAAIIENLITIYLSLKFETSNLLLNYHIHSKFLKITKVFTTTYCYTSQRLYWADT